MWTGDIATWDEEGYVFIVDRAKDMIISGGENIYSTQVEAAIHQHLPQLESAVFGIPDDTWGEAVKAVVVLKPGRSPPKKNIAEASKTWLYQTEVRRLRGGTAEGTHRQDSEADLRDPYWVDETRQV